MCRTIALAFWNNYPEYRTAKKFAASNKWINRFKAHYHLVNRRVHYHRRCQVTPAREKYAKEFPKEISDLYNDKH